MPDQSNMKWVGARVAWRFGAVMHEGTVVSCKRSDVERCLLWRIMYDDGDTEEYRHHHVCEGLRAFRQHRRTITARAPDQTVKVKPVIQRRASESPCAAPSNTSMIRKRRPVDPEQSLVFFPIIVSPSCLTSTRPGASERSERVLTWWSSDPAAVPMAKKPRKRSRHSLSYDDLTSEGRKRTMRHANILGPRNTV